MSFDWSEPTFTLREFVLSWIPGSHWFDPSLENLGYTTVKLGTVVAPLAARAAWIYRFGYIAPEVIAMHGGRWAASGYIATQESWSFMRLMTSYQRAGPWAAAFVGRSILDRYGSPEFDGSSQTRGRLEGADTLAAQGMSVLGLFMGMFD